MFLAMPKLAANLSMLFTEEPFPLRFGEAARAGFSAVEFLFPYDHSPESVAGWLAEHRLKNVLFNLPPGDWAAGERGIACLRGREEEFRDGVVRALEYATRLGTPCLHAMAGIVPAGADRGAHRALYIENLRFAADELARQGRTLLIEPLNPRDVPGYLLASQADAHAIREAVDRPNIKVQMDFYHAQIAEGDLATTFQSRLDGIGHVQIAGVPGRHEPDTGEVDYAYLFDLMDELGYAGWVGCEYRPRGRTEDGLSWITTVRDRQRAK